MLQAASSVFKLAHHSLGLSAKLDETQSWLRAHGESSGGGNVGDVLRAADSTLGKARSLAWNVQEFGLATGLARFGASEGLNGLADDVIKKRARLAEKAGRTVCLCAVAVVAMTFLDGTVPLVIRMNEVLAALGMGWQWNLVIFGGLGGWVRSAVKGMEPIQMMRVVYMAVVVFIAMSRHVLVYQGALGIMRQGSGRWNGWESNVPVVMTGLALLGAVLWNGKVTSKYNLLAKLIACWMLGTRAHWFSTGEILFRVVHFALCMFVEETAPVSDVVVWTGCWGIVHKVDGVVNSAVDFLFEGESDIVQVGLFLIQGASFLMETYAFEDLLIPSPQVQRALIGYHHFAFAGTALIAIKGFVRWHLDPTAEWTFLDELFLVLSLASVVTISAILVIRDNRRFKEMDRAEFFFAQKMEYFDHLKVRVQYEQIRERVSKASKVPKPSKDFSCMFYGKVSSGKSQLIKSLLKEAKSPDADKVDNISAVGGSTTACQKYIAHTFTCENEAESPEGSEETKRLYFIDTPGLDEFVPSERSPKPLLNNSVIEEADFYVIVFNGDSEADLYDRYLEAVQAVCKKNNYGENSKEFRQAWRRVLIVRTHGDLFGWGIKPEEDFRKGWDYWPPGLRTLLETTRERLNSEVLEKNKFDPDVQITDIFHLSTKKNVAYGVDKLWERISKLANGQEGKIIAYERLVSYQETIVESLSRDLNEAARTINRQFVMRKLLNVVKMLVDPFMAIRQQSFSTSWLEHYKSDEKKYSILNAKLENEKEKLQGMIQTLEEMKAQQHSQ